jgi:YD repeat-containing protein
VPGKFCTSGDETTKSDGLIQRETLSDGLMRPVTSELTSDPAGADIVTTNYDALSRVATVTNPYRTTSDSTYGVTIYGYDAVGRKVIEVHPDGTKRQWCYDNSAAPAVYPSLPQNISYAPTCNPRGVGSGEWVDISDENGNDWQEVSDGLGRMTHVIEPSGTSQSPTMDTDYSYDALDNLLQVIQNGQTGNTARVRTFTYDNLSRLITSTNPETGTVCYGVWSGSNCVNGYDYNGNLLFKTDARGITIAYGYDTLNRLISKGYTWPAR